MAGTVTVAQVVTYAPTGKESAAITLDLNIPIVNGKVELQDESMDPDDGLYGVQLVDIDCSPNGVAQALIVTPKPDMWKAGVLTPGGEVLSVFDMPFGMLTNSFSILEPKLKQTQEELFKGWAVRRIEWSGLVQLAVQGQVKGVPDTILKFNLQASE